VQFPAKPAEAAAAVFESGDEKQLFYNGTRGIWSLPKGGGDPKLTVPGVLTAQWAVAGQSLYFVRRGAVQSLWVLRLDTGRQFEYVRFPAGRGPSTSGTTLLFLRTKRSSALRKSTVRGPT
jgi:hypothetical protein